MIGLLCLIFIGLTVFFSVQVRRDEWDGEACTGAVIIFGILSLIFTIWSILLIISLGTGYTIDQKIAMYEEENGKIEENIDNIVKNYMEFEVDAYEKFQDDDAMDVISLFPELKSDTLVQKQIEVYVANNTSIKELKEEKIDLAKVKWQLYFGR